MQSATTPISAWHVLIPPVNDTTRDRRNFIIAMIYLERVRSMRKLKSHRTTAEEINCRFGFLNDAITKAPKKNRERRCGEERS